MKTRCLLLTLALTVPMFANDPADEVRRDEVAFAKAFSDRDAAKFFSFVADDATFIGGRTLSGKKAVVEGWSRFFEGPVAPFSWGPERVAVDASGTTGLSMGPVFDPDGKHAGNFTTTWVKQKDRSWKVLFDSGGPSPANLAETALATEEGFVTADDGVKLHYRKVGNSPVVLIAPLGFILHDDFKQLADRATVITYDMRDRGRSPRVAETETLTIQRDVKDLEAVRKHFNVEKFVPVGYSYLGMVVALYTLDHPEHVTRVVQLGPIPMKFGTQFPKNLTNGYDDMEASAADVKRWQELRAAGMAEKTPREFCEAQEKVYQYLLVGNGAHASRIKLHCELETEWPVNVDRHFKSTFGSIQALEVTKDQFKKIAVPVLTIHGTKDRNAPYGGGREWAFTLPNARLVTVEGAAHQSWADDPVTVFGSIREFLRGNWPLTAEKVSDPSLR
jgi:pimeloyl-ACP methyl ester carboxylesterase/ketosteroid isomerase-like protein